MSETSLKKTPLNAVHRGLGGRTVALRSLLYQVMRNIYATNPGKLAAWISASHVERAPKKKVPTQ